MHPTRRQILRSSIAAAAGAVLVTDARGAAAPRKPGIRLAHLTDLHVQPELGAPAGFAKALQVLASVDPQPEFLITGGDHVMDALAQGRARVDQQWDLYQQVLTEHTKLKTYGVIGNHDVWGWTAKEDLSAQAGYGKAAALDRLGLSRSYYSFDAGGWHFVVLDNIAPRGKDYYGDLDADQLEWLNGDLAANTAKRPVCVISHIPLICVCVLFFLYGRGKDAGQTWTVPDNLLHHNSAVLVKLLVENNVKLCISGHIHLLDRVEYDGVHFVCDGAVCGNWWKGRFLETPEGFGVFDLYSDGTFDHQYVSTGWQAATQPSRV